MKPIEFYKMHGAGNDFIIIDARVKPITLSNIEIKAMTNRHTGIGCDQLILLHESENADCMMHIFNYDGSTAGACGNATRCVAKLLMDELGKKEIVIETISGLLPCYLKSDAPIGYITVDMGKARWDWQSIPLVKEMDTLSLEIELGQLKHPTAVNIGNPHMVFFVDDVDSLDIKALGSVLECHPFFPERTNVGFVQIQSKHDIKLRVYERGTGETLACGSGACAAVVASIKRGLSERYATVQQSGGTLYVTLQEDETISMTGPVALAFKGSYCHASAYA